MARMSTRRKMAIATWTPPREGNIYGKLTLDVGEALDYLEHVRRTTGEKVTITHLVGKAIGMALADAPGLNGRVVLGRFVPFDTVDISFLVVVEGGSDLAKVKVREVDRKSVADIAAELKAGAERVRSGQDDEFESSKGLMRALPTWIIRPLLYATSFVTSGLGWSIKFARISKFPFGSAVLTNVGVFGLDGDVPLLTGRGEEGEEPMVPIETRGVAGAAEHRVLDRQPSRARLAVVGL